MQARRLKEREQIIKVYILIESHFENLAGTYMTPKAYPLK